VECRWAGEAETIQLTSSSDAVGAVAVAALRAGPDDRAVDVLGLVGVDVASAAAAVGDFGSGHVCEGGRFSWYG
jgi:hypothetical protein